jgi:List-Bact-rpt repeat protein
MKKLTLAWIVALLASTQAWAAPADHPTALPSPLLMAAPPARSFVGGTPAYPTCPTFGWQLISLKIYLSTVSPTDSGALQATLPITPAPAMTTWACVAPLPDGTYYLRVSLVDANGTEGEKNQAFAFIIGNPPATFPLTVALAGTGGGAVTGQGDYAPGSSVTLTAVPDVNSTLTSVAPAPCAIGSFPMPAAPLLCTITFTLKPPPPVIGIGSTIFVKTAIGQLLNVRLSAGGPIVGTQPRGAIGTVTGGPTVISGVTWWQIDYATGTDGWSSAAYLSLTPP